MKSLKLDALLLTHPPDLSYLTNFTGDDSVGLITEKGFYLATDFRYQEQAQLEAGWVSIHIKENKMVDLIAKLLKETKVNRVGFEANFTTFGQIDAIDRAVKELGNKELNGDVGELQLVPLEDVMVSIRKVKDDNEIDLIRKSVDIAEQAFEAIRPEIKVGQTENWLAGQLIAELRSRGASGVSFSPIVAAGANSSLPHYRPGEREVTLLKDQPVLFDWGAIYRGYCSDLTRMLLLGRVNPKIKQIYKVVLDAQEAAIHRLASRPRRARCDRKSGVWQGIWPWPRTRNRPRSS
jgi:Xaa-Pro aminopeptidase